jgi:hypothetical protein
VGRAAARRDRGGRRAPARRRFGRTRGAPVAEKLGLSTRTVDNNLARAYTKLGISGRAELRALLDADADAARP